MLCKTILKRAVKKMSSFLKMPQLSNDRRTWVCSEMARVQNTREVKRRWPARWPNIPPPAMKIFTITYQKYFQRERAVHNLNQDRSGRHQTVRTPQNINLVQQSLTQHGNRSSRRNGLGLSPTSFLRIVEQDINLSLRIDKTVGDPTNGLHFATD